MVSHSILQIWKHWHKEVKQISLNTNKLFGDGVGIKSQKFCSRASHSLFFFFFFLFLLRLHLRHMEVPRLGVKLELQLPAYATARATPALSHVCNHGRSLQQQWILNPLCEAKDQTCILSLLSQDRNSPVTDSYWHRLCHIIIIDPIERLYHFDWRNLGHVPSLGPRGESDSWKENCFALSGSWDYMPGRRTLWPFHTSAASTTDWKCP